MWNEQVLTSEPYLSVFSAILDDQAEKEMYKDRFNPFGLDLLGVDFLKLKNVLIYVLMCLCVGLWTWVLYSRGQKRVLDVPELELQAAM